LKFLDFKICNDAINKYEDESGRENTNGGRRAKMDI
jgi:hypothetical protein